MEIYILNALDTSQKTFALYLRSGMTVDLFRKLVEAQEKGRQVDLLVENENSFYLTQDPHLHQLAVRLLQYGGSITQVLCMEPVNAFFLSDYKKIAFVSPSNTKTEFNEVQHRDYLSKIRKYISTLKSKGSLLLNDYADIRISLDISPDFVKSGSTVALSWEVQGAQEVSIDGIGAVEAKGRREVEYFENTIVKISARNQRHVAYESCYVRVFGDIEIQYDLGFLNPVTGLYSSLVNADNYPDVFGVMRGHSIQFAWEVLEAEKVEVKPFGRTEKKGELIFSPEESIEITIDASGNNQQVTRIIHIQMFPVPVFVERQVKLDPKFLQRELKVKIPDQESRLQNPELARIQQESEQLYASLRKKLKQYSDENGDLVNPELLRTMLFADIRRKPGLKKEVKQYIDKLYEQLSTFKMNF